MSLMFGVVIVRKLEIGGREGILRMASWLGLMTRSAMRAYRRAYSVLALFVSCFCVERGER